MTEEDAAERASPSLGWLEAYVATAHHLSYEAAGREIGVHASNVQRKVDKLQAWLHRVLIIGDTPLEVTPDDGMPSFLPVATEVLRLFAVSDTGIGVNPGMRLGKSRRSAVRLVDLKTVLCVSVNTNFEAAASDIGLSYKTVRRRVSTVEAALGGKIFIGRSRLSLSSIGTHIIPSIRLMITLLEGARADVSSFNHTTHMRERTRRALWSCRLTLSAFLASAAKRRLTKIQRLKVIKAENYLVTIDAALARISPDDSTNPFASGDVAVSSDEQVSSRSNASD